MVALGLAIEELEKINNNSIASLSINDYDLRVLHFSFFCTIGIWILHAAKARVNALQWLINQVELKNLQIFLGVCFNSE